MFVVVAPAKRLGVQFKWSMRMANYSLKHYNFLAAYLWASIAMMLVIHKKSSIKLQDIMLHAGSSYNCLLD